MNLILLSPSDFIPGTQRVRLTDRRLTHVLEILKPRPGDALSVGLENGRLGRGRVAALSKTALEMEVSLDLPPPAKLPVVLCVALMRPIVLKRVLQTVTAMGVNEIHLFHSRRVEKSFWQSTVLQEDEIRNELVLGLEQARDTVLPVVTLHKRFKPFAEDVLPELLHKSKKQEARSEKDETIMGIVADPSGEAFDNRWTLDVGRRTSHVLRPTSNVLVLGPEGGFIPYEIDKFKAAGCRIVSLGERILKVETAVAVMLGKMM